MIRVICGHHECRRWAVAFTTLEDNPKPWPEIHREPGYVAHVEPLWYVCFRHRTPSHQPLPEGDQAPVCERCGRTGGIEWTGGGTAYHEEPPSRWDILVYGFEGPPSPNRLSPYCPDCAMDYHEYWDGMWAEYRSMQGV